MVFTNVYIQLQIRIRNLELRIRIHSYGCWLCILAIVGFIHILLQEYDRIKIVKIRI
jgi:hypothetical protein